MTGPKSTEMAVVEGGQFGLIQPLSDCQDPGIHKPHIGVSVPVTKVPNTPIIFGLHFLDPVGAGDYIHCQTK